MRTVPPKNFFAELRRRNVIRATILYLGAVWALAQGISQLGPSVGAPEWATRWFLVAAGVGFPFWIAFAWFYEFTPEGLKRESEIDPAESITPHTGRKLDFAIIGVLTEVHQEFVMTPLSRMREGRLSVGGAARAALCYDPGLDGPGRRAA